MTTSSAEFPRVELLREVADELESLLDQEAGAMSPSSERDLTEVVSVLRNFLVPRLVDQSAPFNVVFAGPTGSGKSTLVNSVVRRRISKAGPIRPTTTQPLVYTHSGNARARGLGRVKADVATGDARILRFLSLIDTPDIDSTSTENHRKAMDVIASADLVVFVASALRYADLVPWEVLRAVARRGVPVIPVLNRVTPENVGSVVDFKRRLEAEGLKPEMITITEHRIQGGILPLATVQHLRTAILDAMGELDRAKALEAAMESVRSDLTDISRSIGNRDAEPEELGAVVPDIGDYDVDQIVARWRGRLKSAGGLASRLVGGERRRVALVTLGREIQEEVITLVERDLRLIAAGPGRVTIDLTDPSGVAVHLESVDAAVSDWYETLLSDARSDSLGAVTLGRRVAKAIDEFEIVFGQPASSNEPAGLSSAMEGIYTGVSRNAHAALQAETIEVLQRARARIRSDALLVDA